MIRAQIAGALILRAVIALAPPDQGTMLLVPVAAWSQGQVTALALARGASVVQRGPLPSSVIVYGARARLFAPLARAGILTLASGAAGCRPGKGRSV